MCGGIVIIYQFALCAYAGGGEEARMPPLHNAVSGLHFIFDLVPPEHVCGSPLSDLSPCSPFFSSPLLSLLLLSLCVLKKTDCARGDHRTSNECPLSQCLTQTRWRKGNQDRHG